MVMLEHQDEKQIYVRQSKNKAVLISAKSVLILPPLFSSTQRIEEVDRTNKNFLIFLPFSISLNVIRLFSVPFRFFPSFFPAFRFLLKQGFFTLKRASSRCHSFKIWSRRHRNDSATVRLPRRVEKQSRNN